MNIIITILAAVGAALIVSKSYIFIWLREFAERWEFTDVLVNCPQCLSFWFGIFFGIIIGFSFNYILVLAFASSFAGELIQKTFYE